MGENVVAMILDYKPLPLALPLIILHQVSYQDCLQIVEACKKNDVFFATGHVLKYSSQALKIKELIDKKVIGDVVNIQHLEPVRSNYSSLLNTLFLLKNMSNHVIFSISIFVL